MPARPRALGNLKMDVQEEETVQNAARKIDLAGEAKDAVRKILDLVKAEKRTSLTAPEGKLVCDAYGIPVPKEGVAKSASEASDIATDKGFPVVMKIVSPDTRQKSRSPCWAPNTNGPALI